MGTSVGSNTSSQAVDTQVIKMAAQDPAVLNVVGRRLLHDEVGELEAKVRRFRMVASGVGDLELKSLLEDLADEYDRVRERLVERIDQLDSMEAAKSLRLSEVLARMPKLNFKWASFALAGIAMLILVAR